VDSLWNLFTSTVRVLRQVGPTDSVQPTIIGVRDVARSFEWYQSLFGQPLTRPAHDDFGQLCNSDGAVLLCLHQWCAHEHPPLMSPEHGRPGNGLLLPNLIGQYITQALKRAYDIRMVLLDLKLPKSSTFSLPSGVLIFALDRTTDKTGRLLA